MEAKYESTRGLKTLFNGKEALLQGISPDGGLFVRKDLGSQQITLDEIEQGSYRSLAKKVLSILLTGYSQDEIDACISEAYDGTFDNEEVSPLRQVGDVEVMELFHGPTSAFKDVALTLLPRLMSRALKDTGKKALILTATSGDTGKAAMSGFEDVDHTGIIVFYPDQKVSAIQYRQMVCQTGSNVEVFGVKGNFDDAQSQVKKLFLDQDLQDTLAKEGIVLSSANSINIGRLIPQIVYYFDAYRQLLEQKKIQKGDEVIFSVPTGNFGDVLAGYYAYLMGLPVKKFIVASNANNVLTDFLTTGVYDRRREFVQTISPSMDILISSNLERLLYYASGMDSEKVAGWMNDLAKQGWYKIDDSTLAEIQKMFDCGSVNDDQTRAEIRDVYEKTGVVLDPHSAIAYALAKKEEGPVVSLATASPYKFSQDVLRALDQAEADEWRAMDRLAEISPDPVPSRLAALREAPLLHTDVIEVDEMKDSVKQRAGDLFRG